MSIGFFAFNRISCPAAPAWLAAGLGALLAVLFLPVVVWKAVVLGQGDVQVYFRAGWAVWTGYPLYEVADRHGWTYQYPPTFALFMGPFADPLPGYPQPWWALPFAAGVVVWYLINAACMLLCIHLWATALERYRFAQIGGGFLQGPVFYKTRGHPARPLPGTAAFHRRRPGTRSADGDHAPADGRFFDSVRREPLAYGLIHARAGNQHQNFPGRTHCAAIGPAGLEICCLDHRMVRCSFGRLADDRYRPRNDPYAI